MPDSSTPDQEGARAALDRLDAVREAARFLDDVDTLARLLKLIDILKAEIAALDRSIQTDLYDILDQYETEIAGIGVLVRSLGKEKPRYDSEKLLDRLMAKAYDGRPESTIDPDTGEVIDQAKEREALRATLALALPITATLGWRKTGLAQLGIEYRDLFEFEPGAKTVRFA